MSRTALVAGATGLVGQFLLQHLLADPRYSSIKVLSRRPLEQNHSKLQTLLTDYSGLESLGQALRADDVYCCLGTTMRKAGSKAAFERVDYHMVVNLAWTTKKASAQRFLVISAAGTCEKSLSYYSRVKAHMEKTVAEAGFETTHILRPSILMGPRREHRPGERFALMASPLLSPLLQGSLKKYRPIEADEVAAAMVTLAWRKASGVHIHHLPL